MSDQEYERNLQQQEARRLRRLELKRKRRIQQRIVQLVLVLILILVVVLCVRSCAGNRAAQAEEPATPSESAAIPADGMRATLAAVGDIMCYDQQLIDALQEDGSYDFSDSFTAVAPYLSTADLTLGNLELNFCGPEKVYAGYPDFAAPETLSGTLSELGFDILQTANTYSIQNGLSGLLSTIQYLKDSSIQPLGTYSEASEKTAQNGVVMKTVNGINLAFMAFTKGVNNMVLPAGAEYCVDLLYKDYYSNYLELNTEAILASVSSAKALGADVVIAMLHWGSESVSMPSVKQDELANLMFENGVDVILGSHSHIVGPMETRTVTRDGVEKEVFVAYSLGNFFSAMNEDYTQESVVLNLEFTKDDATGVTTISSISYLPLYICDHGEQAPLRYEVLPIRSAMESSLFPEMNDTLRSALQHLKRNTASDFDSGK